MRISALLAILVIISITVSAADVVFQDGKLTTSGLDVNTNTLYVDEVNDRVGVGTNSPTSPLHISTSGVSGITINDNSNNIGSVVIKSTGTDPGLTIESTAANGKKYGIFSGGGASSYAGDFAIYDFNRTTVPFIIESYGNVGIGTTDPMTKLHVVDNSNSEILINRSSGASLRLLTDGTQGYVGTGTNHPLRFLIASGTKMLLDTDGDLGIGTTSPSAKLHVNGNVKIGNSYTTEFPNYGYGNPVLKRFQIHADYGGQTNPILGTMRSDDGTNFWELAFLSKGFGSFSRLLSARYGTSGTGGTEKFYITATGDEYLAGTLKVAGSGLDTNYALQLPNDASKKAKANAWDTYSDKRYKVDRGNLNNALSMINQLQPKYYTWIDNEQEKSEIGLFAQDVNEVIPELVTPAETENDSWSMDYAKLSVVLLAAVQELETELCSKDSSYEFCKDNRKIDLKVDYINNPEILSKMYGKELKKEQKNLTRVNYGYGYEN